MSLSCKADEYRTSDGFCVACPKLRRGCLTHKELNPDVYQSCLDCINFISTAVTSDDTTMKIIICVGAVAIVLVVVGLTYCLKKRRSRNISYNETNTGTKSPKQHDDDGYADHDLSSVEENDDQQPSGLFPEATVKALEDACHDQNKKRNEEESLQVLINSKS